MGVIAFVLKKQRLMPLLLARDVEGVREVLQVSDVVIGEYMLLGRSYRVHRVKPFFENDLIHKPSS